MVVNPSSSSSATQRLHIDEVVKKVPNILIYRFFMHDLQKVVQD